MTRGDGRPPIEDRLQAAGLPPLPRPAWLEIDLDALTANLAAIRARVPAGTRVLPVVKADAYGHGALPVARALEEAGADGFAVAFVDEALELRRGGVGAPIVVLYPVPAERVRDAGRHGIEVTIGTGELAERVLEAIGRAAPVAPIGVHVEVETGLGRGGVTPEELPALLARIEAEPHARLTGAWTHLTAGEDEARTAAQEAAFERAVASLATGSGAASVIRHLAASAGILAGSAVAHDAVRPGLSIYGLAPEELGPDAGPAAGLRPVMALHARPVRVVGLPAGHGVGYGPAFTTSRPTRIATLPLGYGDGYARTMSGRAEAVVRGRRVPIVGTIAMDGVMADVTDVPGPPVNVHDEFVLLGEQDGERITVEELARWRTTISWEVVTAMSARLPRVYHAAGGRLATRRLEGE